MKKTLSVLCFLLCTCSAYSQYLRSSYFMEGATNRIQLNPALRPSQGFVDIPVLGAFQISASSNTLGVRDIYEIIESEEDFFDNDKLFNRLKTDNRLNVNLNTDIISFGFYKGKGFWSGSLGVRADINGSIPKSMMEYARIINNEEFEDTEIFNIKNQSLNVNLYTEAGIGYSREITKKLTVGAKLKFLLGVANMDMKVNQLYIEEGGTYTKTKSDANLNVSMKGMGVIMETDEYNNEYISDIEFDEFGIAGYGFGIDLGATYKVTKDLTVSAALLDLGFISWSKGSTTTAKASKDQTINYDYEEWGSNGEIFDLELIGFSIDDPQSRTTSLASTLVVGAEYAFLNNRLSAGVLSTTRFGKPKTLSELTFSANYRPKKWFNAALSYSVLQSEMKTFGLALKLGPVFLGTDYMFFGGSSETRNVNAYLGISVPLGGKKNKNKESKN